MPESSQDPPQADTKQLLLWIAGKWGAGAVFGLIALYGLSVVYQDMRKDREDDRVYRAQETEINVRTAEILQRMETRLESIERRIAN
tara:strand:+ start:13107 stop:13367 length:261 start_codon:yes stop_codon:yes gene_type:complete